MAIRIFSQIRKYLIRFIYNMYFFTMIKYFVLYLPFKRSSSMTEKFKIYDNKRSEERFIYRALGERSNLFHSKLTNLPF